MLLVPKVYILILNYNGWEDTIECLESVFRLKYSNFQVVVVDNDSPNDSLKFIKLWADGKLNLKETHHNSLEHIFISQLSKPIIYQYFDCTKSLLEELRFINHKLTLIQSGSNKGFAAGNNIFLRTILNQDAYVWLLNPDMVVESNSLEELIQCIGSDQKPAVIGTVVKDYYNPDSILMYGGSELNLFTGTVSPITTKDNILKLDYISGGSFFTHISNFNKIGLLPEDYFLYWEETDWCHQAKLNAVHFKVCENTVCYDKGGTSIGRGFLAEYYYSLNALRFLRKYKEKYIPSVLFFNLFRILKRLMKGQFTRVKGIWKASYNFLFNEL